MKTKYHMNRFGLSKVIYNEKTNKYFLEGFNTIEVDKNLVFDSPEDAIINNYFNRVNILNKEEEKLKKRLLKIKKDKEKIKTELKISEIQKKFPEKFLI